MEIKKVAILANTTAGKGKSKQISIWLQEQLITLNKLSTIYDLEWPSDADLNQYSDAWVIGGDGTINYFINKKINYRLKFHGYVDANMFNIIPNSLDIENILKSLLRIYLILQGQFIELKKLLNLIVWVLGWVEKSSFYHPVHCTVSLN